MAYKNKEDEVAYRRRYYLRNKEIMNNRANESRDSRRAKIYKIINKRKSETPCADCKQFYHYTQMDFDHLESSEKVSSIANMIGQTRSLESIETEIAKCELVCANCHRLRHYHRRVKLKSLPNLDNRTILMENY